MAGMLEDMERRIDAERARAQAKKAQQEADRKIKAAQASQKGRSSLFF